MNTENGVLLEDIPFQPDFEGLRARLHVRPGSSDAAELTDLLVEAAQIAHPVAYYRLASIDRHAPETLVVDGVRFTSRVLSKNLEDCQQVIAFVASCGTALQTWGEMQDDFLRQYWAEAIKEDALRAGLAELYRVTGQTGWAAHSSTMSPGSLESWPISQQQPLFELLGPAARLTGVQLSADMLMIPTKSVSGIIFPTDGRFESCQLCQRTDCPNRRAPYDETLYEREYCPAE